MSIIKPDPNELWSVCKPKMIPDISDEDIEEMLKQIRPVQWKDDCFHEILTDGVNRRETAYIWEPKLGRKLNIYRDGLNKVEILTIHTWTYYKFFKPTLAEVFACIRMFVPDYSQVRFVWLNAAEMDWRNIIGDYHWCPCVLFGEEHDEPLPEWKS